MTDPDEQARFAFTTRDPLESKESPTTSPRTFLRRTLFGRLAELAEYVDGDTVHETVDRCPSKVE